MSIIDNILDKPANYRKKVAFATTGLIGIVIFTAWIAIAGNSVKQSIKSRPSDQDAANLAKNQPSLRDESLKTKLVSPDSNQNEDPDQPEEQNTTFETVLRKQSRENSERKIIERP